MCPHCRQQESISMDHDHFLTCSLSGRRKQLRLNLFNTLLQHLNTPPALSKLLVHGLQSFYNSQINNTYASSFKTINNQRKIGWNNFSRGRISKQFTITMNNHYKNTTYQHIHRNKMDKTTHSIHLINTHRRMVSSIRIQLQSKPNNLPKYIHVPREKIAPYNYCIFLLDG